jgi:uncharacterized membrane protein (UPF0127 family)
LIANGVIVLRRLIEMPDGLRQITAMKFRYGFALVLTTLFFVGCSKGSSPAPNPATSINDTFPKQAQAKLPTMKLYVGAEIVDAELALTGEQIQTGMMFRTNIQDSDTMLFDLRVPQRASFWMKNCPESISAAYISPDGVIQEIHHLEQNDTNAVLAATDNIRFVLETSEGWFTRHHVNPGTVITTEKGSLAETFMRR